MPRVGIFPPERPEESRGGGGSTRSRGEGERRGYQLRRFAARETVVVLGVVDGRGSEWRWGQPSAR
jgi:hypothetical protein